MPVKSREAVQPGRRPEAYWRRNLRPMGIPVLRKRIGTAAITALILAAWEQAQLRYYLDIEDGTSAWQEEMRGYLANAQEVIEG